MGSVNYVAVGAKRAASTSGNSKAAKRLVDKHGEDADAVAARRADALFRQGDVSEGNRWLEIFRSIAMSCPRC